MPIVQVTQPASFPVTLAEALTTCRLNLGDADADVTALIGVATDFVENYILRAIMPRTFALYAGAFPETFRLTRGPATAISSLVYVDAAGVRLLSRPVHRIRRRAPPHQRRRRGPPGERNPARPAQGQHRDHQ